MLVLKTIVLGYLVQFIGSLNSSKFTLNGDDHLKFTTFLPDGDIVSTAFLLDFKEGHSFIHQFPVEKEMRIAGGRVVQGFDAPYQVAILWEDNHNHTIQYCGGVLIDNITILSAAHCFNVEKDGDKDLDHYVLMMGKIDLRKHEPSEMLGLAMNIIVHEEFSIKVKQNDIAIVHLREPVTFNQKLQPMELPLPGTKYQGTANVSGWGGTIRRPPRSKLPNTISPLLKIAEIDTFSKQECEKLFREFIFKDEPYFQENPNDPIFDIIHHHPSVMCGGNLKEGINICSGDSGGPLVCKYRDPMSPRYGEQYLCGIASAAAGCGTELPALYADVEYFLPWINARRPWIRKDE